MKKVVVLCFVIWSIIIGILVLTGALHFVFNEADSFKIEGLYTNPTLVVILVAVSLLVMGVLMILYPFYYFLTRKETNINSIWVFMLWYFILTCLTFFMTGILGLVVSAMCFVTTVILLISIILIRFPMKESEELEANDKEKNSDKIMEEGIV
ncbi:Uncharacterized protein QTN25_003148 [Entamoeba marina]